MQTGGPQSSSATNGSHFHRYLQYAASLLASYKGNEPFHLFLKKYFSSNKKHGSRDRKLIASLCYDYFRLGYGVSIEMNVDEKLRLGSFLCEANFSFSPGFEDAGETASNQLPLPEKLTLARKQFDSGKIFPFAGELSDEINCEQFCLSFLIQPRLFIRIRTGFTGIVINKIKEAGFAFEEPRKNCLSFANNEKVSSVIDLDKEAVIQDYNSQITLQLLEDTVGVDQPGMNIWDCCAGSGGKSILAFDIFKNIQLTVTDKRENILDNLQQRFARAGIINYQMVLADLQAPVSSQANIAEAFDLVIADVPCTGSGTWSRTPEQLVFFRKKEIETYVALQRKIIGNAISRIKADGYFLYITCSVFKKENEENTEFIREKFQLSLLGMQYLKGYDIQADTLFVALFKNQEHP